MEDDRQERRAVFFGESDDSRLVGDFPLNPADSVRMWALTRVVDLHGNFYEVRYRQDSGEIYPAKIIYTQNTNGGIARFRTVEFEYDENAYPNAAYSYASSSPTRTRWRLRDIVVQVNVVTFLGITIPFTGDLVRRYHLEYETSAASGLSRLISIQEFGSDNSTALSPHLFEWHTSPQDFTQTFTTPADNSGWSKNYGDTIVGDFNGDGKSDIVLQGQYDTYTNLHLSSGDTFKDTAISMDTFTNGWRLFDFSGEESLKVTALGDIDGDGRIDIVSSFAAQNTTTNIIDRYVFSPDTTDNIGTRLIHLPKNNTSMYDATDRNIHVADFDGDGRSDILLQANTTAQASYIIRSTGIATNLTFQRIELDIAISGTDTLLIADFNGDARNDILQCTKNEALGHSTVKLHLSSYDATIAPVGAPIRFKTQNLPMLLPLDCRATLGDFNGDGKLDVISSTGGHKLYLGNGFTFADAVVIDTQSIALTGVHTAAESTLLAGDFNGDGRDDLFVYSTSSLAGAHIAYSYGENFSGHGGLTSFPWQSTDAKWRTALNDVTLADINGDGRIDIVVSEKRPQGVNPPPARQLSVLISNTTPNDKLRRVTTPTGATLDVEYTPATNSANAIKPLRPNCTTQYGVTFCDPMKPYGIGTSSLPNTARRHLVSQVTLGDGRGGTFSTAYEYENGRVSIGTILQRESLGFEKIKTTDVNSGNYSIAMYRQDRPFHGQVQTKKSYLADGTLVTEEIAPTPRQYLCDESGCVLDAASNPNTMLPRQVRQSGQSEQRQYIDGYMAFVMKSETVAYDAYGNPLESQTSKRLGSDMITETAYATFINNLGDATHARAIGLPVTSKKCLADCSLFNISEDKEFYYDNQPLGQTSLRNLVTCIKAKAGPQVLTKNLHYYPNGNLQSESGDTSVIKTFIYDSNYSQYITETRIIIPDKPDQVTTQKIDPRYGIVIESTDINGTKKIMQLDVQGHIIDERIRKDDGTLLRRVSYEDHLTGNINSVERYAVQCSHRKANSLDNEFIEKSCSYTYVDAMNRKYLQITRALNGASETYSAVHTIYDNQGRVIKVSSPYFKDTTSAIGTPTQYAETIYDNYGRIWKQIGVDGKTIETNIVYNGGNRITTQTIGLDSGVTESSTDVTGAVRETTQAKGTALENTVSYIYYTNGLPWQISAPQGLTILEYYPDTKQQKSITDPNTGKTDYTYITDITSPAFGKLLTETRPAPNSNGIVTVMHEYDDPYGRLTRQVYSTGDEVIFTYDEADVSFGRNKLTTTEFKSNDYSYKQRHSYNEFGQAVQSITDIAHATETLCTDADELPCHAVVSIEYDEQGRKKKVIYPDLKETSFSYFGASPHIASIVHDGKTYASYDGYNLRAKITGIHYGNGTRTEFDYDGVSGILSNLKTFDSQSRPIQDLNYYFNEALNITAIDDNIVAAASYEYEYDALNRIKKATRLDGKVFNYSFDARGNLTLKENRTQHFYANSTKLEYSDLATINGTIRTNFTWSASGNLLQRSSTNETISYTWSAQNFLIESVRAGGQLSGAKTSNVYAGEGNRYLRVYEQPGKQKVKTWLIGGLEIRETFSGDIRDNVQVTKYIYGIDGGRIASITGNLGELIVSATSGYQFFTAKFYSSQTITGLTAKVPYLFMGCYYFVGEVYNTHKTIILLSLMIFVLLLLVLLSRERHEVLNLREFSKRFLGFTMVTAFFVVNCTNGKHDSTFSIPTYYEQIPNLYAGLPTGVNYYHANHLGSSTVVTDETGFEKIRIHYTTYGEIDQNLSGRWDHNTNTLVHNSDQAQDAYLSVAYTGQSYSIEEEMYFYGARHYDSTVGIFVSADSIIDPNADNLGFNRYLYVAGNPIQYFDPTGHNIFDDIGDFFNDIGDALSDAADWWSDNVYKPMRDWWDKNIGSQIKSVIGKDAFNVLAGLAGGLLPVYGMIQASVTGGPLNVLLYMVGAGVTGLLNMVGCVGCYVNLSYTYSGGFGFGIGWGTKNSLGAGVNIGIMYRERGALAGFNSTVGVGIKAGNLDIAVNIFLGQQNAGVFATVGASDSTMALGASVGAVCGRQGCQNSYSGYSAVDYSRAFDFSPYNTKDQYYTQGKDDIITNRYERISYGDPGGRFTFSLDINGLAGAIFGERGMLGWIGQAAGLKPTSVLHDYLAVKHSLGKGDAAFYGSMLPSFAIAQPLADMNYRVNQGYAQFRYGY